MTPEDAAHHEWLSELRHQRPKIVGAHSRTSPAKLKSTGDDSNDNDRGKALQKKFIAKLYVETAHITKLAVRSK